MTKTSNDHVWARDARSTPGRWWGLAVIAIAQLMVTLDTTIVAVALPSMQHAVGLTDASRQWVLTAYAVTFGGLLLLGGRLGDILGHSRALRIGVLGFVTASAIGGAATTGDMLVAARAMQGVFAALIAPAALALVGQTFSDPSERARAYGVFAATSMSGGAAGLIIGGVLTTSIDWRWCFYVNVPIGAGVLIGGLSHLPRTRPAKVRLDWYGAALATTGMVVLVYGLSEAAIRGWDSGLVLGSLALAALVLTGFWITQIRSPEPLVPLRVLLNPAAGGSLLAMGLAAFCLLGMFLAMTYHLQTVMGFSPLQTGLAFLAYVGTAAAYSTWLAGRLLPRLGPAVMIGSGLLLCAGGQALLTRLTTESSYAWDILPALVLFGLGVGNLAVPIYNTAMSVANGQDSGTMSALIATTQQLGGAIGVALLNTIAASAAIAYRATHPDEGPHPAAVHGIAISTAAGAFVALLGAILCWAVIRINAPARA